jgi:hypothetical protein
MFHEVLSLGEDLGEAYQSYNLKGEIRYELVCSKISFQGDKWQWRP